MWWTWTLDTDDDSEDFEDNEEYNVPIINVQLQREIRRQELTTENSELTADWMEAEATLAEEQDETDKIREDICKIEAQIERLKEG